MPHTQDSKFYAHPATETPAIDYVAQAMNVFSSIYYLLKDRRYRPEKIIQTVTSLDASYLPANGLLVEPPIPTCTFVELLLCLTLSLIIHPLSPPQLHSVLFLSSFPSPDYCYSIIPFNFLERSCLEFNLLFPAELFGEGVPLQIRLGSEGACISGSPPVPPFAEFHEPP